MARSSRQLEVTRRHQQTSGRQIRLRLAALLSGPANQVVVARLPNSPQLHYSWLIQIRIRQTVCGPLFPFRETIDTELPFLPAALGRVGGCWLCIMIIASHTDAPPNKLPAQLREKSNGPSNTRHQTPGAIPSIPFAKRGICSCDDGGGNKHDRIFPP